MARMTRELQRFTLARSVQPADAAPSLVPAFPAASPDLVNPPSALQVFTFTEGVDRLRGTRGDDTFAGVLGARGTFSAADRVDGGEGFDTLELAIGAQGVPADADPPRGGVYNVEAAHITNATGLGQRLSGQLFGAATDVLSKGSTAELQIDNLTQGARVGYLGTAQAGLGFAYADGRSQGQLLLGTGTAGEVKIGGRDLQTLAVAPESAAAGRHELERLVLTAGQLRTLSLHSGDGVAEMVLRNVALRGAAATWIEVHGAGRVQIDALHGSFAGLDATSASGNVEIFASERGGFDGAFDYRGGSGTDTYHVRSPLTTGRAEGGAGQQDLLVVHDGQALGFGDRHTGFEHIAVADTLVNLDLLDTDFQRLYIRDGDAAGGTSIEGIDDLQAADIVVNSADGLNGIIRLTGFAERMQLSLAPSDGEFLQLGSLIAPVGVTDLAIVSAQAADYALTVGFGLAFLERFTSSGSGSARVVLEFTGFAAGEEPHSFDFSGHTGRVEFDAAVPQQPWEGPGVHIRDGASADRIVGSGFSDRLLFTGGADDIALGLAGDTIDLNDRAGSAAFAGGVQWSASAAESRTSGAQARERFDAARHFDVAVADSILGVRADQDFGDTQGSRFILDTGVAASSLQLAAGGSFFFNDPGSVATAGGFVMVADGTRTYLLQDTNGNRMLEDGEFLVRLAGTGGFTADDFSLDGAGRVVFQSVA